jgi:Fe2+ or Zn2+ uptake regulation protein
MNDSLPQGSEQRCLTCTSKEQDAISIRRVRGVLKLILWVYPGKLTLRELVHELPNSQADFYGETVRRVVDNLVDHGLIYRDGDFLRATEAARYFDSITCFS